MIRLLVLIGFGLSPLWLVVAFYLWMARTDAYAAKFISMWLVVFALPACAITWGLTIWRLHEADQPKPPPADERRSHSMGLPAAPAAKAPRPQGPLGQILTGASGAGRGLAVLMLVILALVIWRAVEESRRQRDRAAAVSLIETLPELPGAPGAGRGVHVDGISNGERGALHVSLGWSVRGASYVAEVEVDGAARLVCWRPQPAGAARVDCRTHPSRVTAR